MILTSYESKNAIESVGQTKESRGKVISSIALYIPPNSLRQTTNSNWEGVAGGALRAGAVTGLDKLFSLGEGGVMSDIANIMSGVGMSAVSKAAETIDKGSGILSAGSGLAVNNHMAMAYKGPGQFRTHEFAFNFFPKDQTDAEDINAIIADFRNGMLPGMYGLEISETRGKLSQPFFRSPRHWDIQLFHVVGNEVVENNYLFKIKKSVITAMTVNHDPNSVISLHADGSPVQTNFSLTFQEIEFPTSDDKGSEHAVGPAPPSIENVSKAEIVAHAKETRKLQKELRLGLKGKYGALDIGGMRELSRQRRENERADAISRGEI